MTLSMFLVHLVVRNLGFPRTRARLRSDVQNVRINLMLRAKLLAFFVFLEI